MQKETALSNWVFISKLFLGVRENFEISILVMLIFGLFSNPASAQLALQDFNSGIPATWAIASNAPVTNNWVPTTATGGYLSTPGAMVNPALNNTVGTTAEYFLITPQFVTPNATEIRFHTRQGVPQNRGTIYQLRLSTAVQPDVSSFNVVLQSWTEAQLNVSATTYEEKIVTIPSLTPNVPVYLAFVAVTNQKAGASPGSIDPATQGDTWYIDNVRVIESCAKVTGIESTMSANGGLITWTHNSATNFEIQLVEQGQPIAATGTAVNGFSYTATGLKDGTNYDVYIKTICDPTTGSLWAGPFPVKTLRLGLSCATPIFVPTNISTTPYVLSSDLKTFYDNQTYTALDSKLLSCQPPAQTMNWLSGEHAFLSYTPTASGLVNVSLSVNVNSAQGCYNNLSSVFIFDSCTGIGTTANCLGSLITGYPSNSVQLPNVYLEAAKTYYFVISSPYQHANSETGAAGICFTFTLSQPSCPIPSGMAYDNLTQTSASFSWSNPQNLVSNWEYVIKPASQGAPVGTDVLMPTSTNLNNIPTTPLTPNTAYNLYVRSVCSGTPGEWSSPFPFKTLCNVFPTPYSTQFTGATPENPEPCWTSFNLNNDAGGFTYSTDFSPGAPQGEVVRLRTFDSGTQTNDLLASPQVHLDGVTQKRLRFKFKGYGGYTNNTGFVLGESSFAIKLSTTGIGPNNFTTEILPIQTYQTGNNWVEKIVPIPANVVGDVSIAWLLPPGVPNTASNFYLDDVYIEDLPACSEPLYPGVTAGSITTNSAQLFWTNGYNNSQWEIKVQPLNSGVPTTSGELVTTNPFTKTGLTSSTKYEYYVRAYCSETLQSVWVGPAKFTTLCEAQPVPYHESFDDVDPLSKKFCWSVINKGNDAAQWRISDKQAAIQPQGIFSTPFSSYDDYLVSVPVNVVGTKILKFKYLVSSNVFYPAQRSNFEVLMSSTPDFASSTVLIPSHEVIANADFVEEFVIFDGPATGPAYFAIHVPSTVNDPLNTGPLVIDDFKIEDAPNCPNPTLLTVSALTQNSATLNWVKGNVETQWEVVVQAPNSGVPTGSGTVVNTNPTYIATGLTANTNYEYFVRAVCGSDFSAWIGPIAFKTTCNVLPTPFVETFEANSPSESCWITVNNNNDLSEWFLSSTVNPIYGEQQASLNCYKNGKNEDWMISPTLAVKANQRLRFSYRSLGAVVGEDLKVQVSTQGTDISNFTTTIFDTATSGVITNTEPKEMVINLTGITALTNVNFAFHVPTLPPDPSGLRGSILYIDNVIVEDIPACSSVYNVSNKSISDTSAVVDWESKGSETSWQISVQPFGTPAPVGNTLPQYLKTATAHPYTITGLTPSTKYQYYVRAVCGGTSDNVWVGPIDLLTKCDLSNVCQYTVSLSNGSTGQVYQGLQVIQNGVVQQTLTFPAVAPNQPTVLDYEIFLCSGIEWSLYWIGSGSGLQYSQAQAVIKDQSGNVVFTSPLGLGKINSNIFTGFSSCKTVTCPQPTNLAVNNMGVLSWTPGGSEAQWEVFVQPLGLGSIPQSGVVVNTPSYTPVASDFLDPYAGTNEFFVRAVCGSGDTSYWTGPKVFVRNDEPETAVILPVNTDGNCSSPGNNASFIGATPSLTPTNCSGSNGGDVWYEFVATSKVHTVELGDFYPGSYSAIFGATGDAFPTIILSLYEVQTDGSLVEKACSENHVIVTTYSSELTVGKTYKIRVKYVSTTLNDKKFDICVSTPADICDLDAFNYSFEKLPMQDWRGDYIFSKLMPGWRSNTNGGIIFVRGGGSSEGEVPYEGGQFLQLIQDPGDTGNPLEGLYKDFEVSSDIKKINYSFAASQRAGQGKASTVELWAGPPSGPLTKIAQHTATIPYEWTLVTGTYDVPSGQTVTRFLFKGAVGTSHQLLDAANFKVPTNNILTENEDVNCKQTSVTATAEQGEEGVGEWFADPNNPAQTVIETPQNTTTVISGLSTPGNYIYYWRTRYCEKSFTVTVQEVTEVPTAESSVQYCTTDTPVALTATAPAGFTLEWYTDPTGGIGSVNAPIPSVAVEGTTTYYVAAVDAGGCVGPRIPIQVVVKKCATAIPKGISPDGDGKNDNFDLTDFKVKRLEIFNRYGSEVYSLDNYTNEWHGQTNSGELPDGTYFYQIHSTDNKITAGWVFINRKQ